MGRDMESLRLSSDGRAFLDALGELIGTAIDSLQAVADVIAAASYRFVLAHRREGFSVRNERPSATVARR